MSATRTVIVTGGSRGLGLGIASALAAQGYRVVAVARREKRNAESRHRGCAGVAPFRAVRSRTSRRDASVRARRAQGVRPHLRPRQQCRHRHRGRAGDDADGGDRTPLHVNTLAPMALTKHVVRSMMAASTGRIVNMSSIIGSTGYGGLSVYAATKASMIGFTRSLAREVGPLGITVNAIAPGFVDTEMTSTLDDAQLAKIARRSALGRLATVQDVAAAATFLMSDAAAGITGTVMTVDAGNSA